DPSSEIKLHQSINGFLSRLNNIQETLVRTNLVLIASVFVHVRGNQHGETLFLRWHRNRTTDLSTGTLRGVYDLLGRLVDEAMIKSLQTNSYALVLHTTN